MIAQLSSVAKLIKSMLTSDRESQLRLCSTNLLVGAPMIFLACDRAIPYHLASTALLEIITYFAAAGARGAREALE